MENEQLTLEEKWKLATQKTQNYYKLEEDKRVKLTFHDWDLHEKEVPDFNDKEKKVVKWEFESKVFYKDENDKVCESIFSTISKRLYEKLMKFLINKDPKNDFVVLEIKKLDKGNKVNYDIEEVKPEK